MHYNMRIGQNSGKFEKKYDQEKLTNGGYITAKLNQKQANASEKAKPE